MRKVAGIDLGGTKIASGIVDEKGRILRIDIRDSEGQKGRKTVLKNLSTAIEELIKDFKVEAIGIGSPGTIDIEKGKVLKIGGNIRGWAYTDIRGDLEKKFKDIPIFLENDANVAAICESWIGAGKELDNFVMITLGTGLGGGIYCRQSGIWHGKNYQAGELGHTILYPDGRDCSCGQKGCAEQYISGNGIERNYYELTGINQKGIDIFNNLKKDKDAARAVDEFIKDLGRYLINIKNIFDPEGIIIGGGVINSREHWWDRAVDYYKKNSTSPSGTSILAASYLNDSGIIGAAKLALDRQK